MGPTAFRIVGAFAVLMGFFALTLKTAIGDSIGTPWVMLGLIPVQDAADYYGEAVDLLTRGAIETLRGRTNFKLRAFCDRPNIERKLTSNAGRRRVRAGNAFDKGPEPTQDG